MCIGYEPARSPHMVVLFDGVCNLCNAWVNRVIDRDPGARVRFLPLQSPAAEALLCAVGLGTLPLSTIVVLEQGRSYLRSTAVLRVSRAMGFPWRMAWPLLVWIPAPVRDLVYRALAATRYRIFGRTSSCRLPTPGLMAHFLDGMDVAAAVTIAAPSKARATGDPIA